ncbi:hypothetical protein ABKN59_009140 [Abortiporus biennis]
MAQLPSRLQASKHRKILGLFTNGHHLVLKPRPMDTWYNTGKRLLVHHIDNTKLRIESLVTRWHNGIQSTYRLELTSNCDNCSDKRRRKRLRHMVESRVFEMQCTLTSWNECHERRSKSSENWGDINTPGLFAQFVVYLNLLMNNHTLQESVTSALDDPPIPCKFSHSSNAGFVSL